MELSSGQNQSHTVGAYKYFVLFILHPSPRNPKYQKWMPMESVNAECLDMV